MFDHFRLASHCVLCHTLHRERFALCALCICELPKLAKTCITCTNRLPKGHVLRCIPCQNKPPALDYILCNHLFSAPLRHLLHAFKYREAVYLTTSLAALMHQALPIHYTTECLMPVPMYKTQLKQRGFNQTQLLAQHLSRTINRPMHTRYCKKIRDTAHQAGLSARERQHNLAEAFIVTPPPFKHVTLIDDLITTGSTANELARQLKKNGVIRVDLWCCAKAIIE